MTTKSQTTITVVRFRLYILFMVVMEVGVHASDLEGVWDWQQHCSNPYYYSSVIHYSVSYSPKLAAEQSNMDLHQ